MISFSMPNLIRMHHTVKPEVDVGKTVGVRNFDENQDQNKSTNYPCTSPNLHKYVLVTLTTGKCLT